MALALRENTPEPVKRSIRKGWSSSDLTALDQKLFGELFEIIGSYCGFALAESGLPETKFRLQAWINIQEQGGFNFLHAHCGALLSGCFYLQVPDRSGNLVFRDPRPGVLSSFGSGVNAPSDVAVGPEIGLLRLFPPWLEHLVEPHEGDSPRIVVSFNAVRL